MRVFNLMDNLWDYFSSFEGIDSETGAILSFFVFWIIFCLIIGLISWIFNVIARWIFFNKCKESGWKAIIPIYDEITLLKVSGLNWWWIFLIYGSAIFSVIQIIISIPVGAINSFTLGFISLFISFLSFFVSIATIIAKVNESWNIAKKFNKGGGHAALIFFFEPIMFLIMGLSKEYEYDTELKVQKNGFFGK